MKSSSIKACFILFVIGVAFFPFILRADDWILYAASNAGEDPGLASRDWYVLNKKKPVPDIEAMALHYYDRESIGGNFDFPGGIFRVWEKYVVQRNTKSYEEAKAEVEKEEEKRLKRTITALDYARLFPLAVNRATKEVQTLYEINCDSTEFIILEVNHYDKDGNRMTRETNMDMELWYPIESDTVMNVLFQKICVKRESLYLN